MLPSAWDKTHNPFQCIHKCTGRNIILGLFRLTNVFILWTSGFQIQELTCVENFKMPV
jgi:hypothetical protein